MGAQRSGWKLSGDDSPYPSALIGHVVPALASRYDASHTSVDSLTHHLPRLVTSASHDPPPLLAAHIDCRRDGA